MNKIEFDLNAIVAEFNKEFTLHSGKFTAKQIDGDAAINEYLGNQHRPNSPEVALAIECKDQFIIVYVIAQNEVFVYNKHNARSNTAYVRQSAFKGSDPQLSILNDALRAARALFTINEVIAVKKGM